MVSLTTALGFLSSSSYSSAVAETTVSPTLTMAVVAAVTTTVDAAKLL